MNEVNSWPSPYAFGYRPNSGTISKMNVGIIAISHTHLFDKVEYVFAWIEDCEPPTILGVDGEVFCVGAPHLIQ